MNDTPTSLADTAAPASTPGSVFTTTARQFMPAPVGVLQAMDVGLELTTAQGSVIAARASRTVTYSGGIAAKLVPFSTTTSPPAVPTRTGDSDTTTGALYRSVATTPLATPVAVTLMLADTATPMGATHVTLVSCQSTTSQLRGPTATHDEPLLKPPKLAPIRTIRPPVTARDGGVTVWTTGGAYCHRVGDSADRSRTTTRTITSRPWPGGDRHCTPSGPYHSPGVLV